MECIPSTTHTQALVLLGPTHIWQGRTPNCGSIYILIGQTLAYSWPEIRNYLAMTTEVTEFTEKAEKVLWICSAIHPRVCNAALLIVWLTIHPPGKVLQCQVGLGWGALHTCTRTQPCVTVSIDQWYNSEAFLDWSSPVCTEVPVPRNLHRH